MFNLTDRIRARNFVIDCQRRGLASKEKGLIDFGAYKNISDFMVSYVNDKKIRFYDIPSEFADNVEFLVKLCKSNITRLNDVYDCTKLFDRVIKAMPLPVLKDALTNASIDPKVKAAIKRYIKNVEKTQIYVSNKARREMISIDDNKTV